MATAAVESYHVEKGSINIPLSDWPKVVPIEKNAVADTIAIHIVDQLNAGLADQDYDAVAKLFLKDGHWRDHLASSMDFRTLKGRDDIIAFIKANPFVWRISIERETAFRMPHFGPLDLVGDPQGITFHVSFIAHHGSGRGVFRLADEGNGWGIFTVFLSLQEIGDVSEPWGYRRPNGHYDDAEANTKNWHDRRMEDFEFAKRDPTVFIVGAGQAGLMISARLKMLGVDTLCIDTNDRVGDNWRRRYHSLVLHDPVYYDQMPYMPFPKFWPLFIPKDKLADWFEAYATNLELNVWTKTKLLSSSWDDNEFQWTVQVERTKANGEKEKRTFKPRHIIQCTGHSGKKFFPDIKGMDSFKGDVLSHSSDYIGVAEDMTGKGKKAIVVGACNSGHDIARDYYEHGYEVTMVQRSSTCVVSSSSIKDIGLAGLYDETSPDVEDADLWLWGMPPELFKTQQTKVYGFQREADKETLEGLEKAGFKCDDGPDSSGLFIKYLQRGGGYYIDVGASKMIADGKIKVKHGQQIEEVQEHGLKFADGTTLEADEIIFATGYQNMRTQAQITFGDEVYDRVQDVWGFDKEGEFRGIFRRSGHPGFWFFGGNFPLCRYYSRLLALQIKAIEMGHASQEPGNYTVGKASQENLLLNPHHKGVK